MKAKKEVREILETIGTIQTLISRALGNHYNDRDQEAFGNIATDLQQAFELCVKIRDMYAPI